MSGMAPLARKYEAEIPAIAAASNGSATLVAEYAGVVSAVTYVPTATITGAATNNRTISVVNHAQDGSGSTVVASLNFGAGTNATGYDEKAITLSGTAANLVVAAGDVLEVRSAAVGTGIADPGGTAFVTIART